MSTPLNIGLLGLGRAGRFHLQSLRVMDEAKLVSVFDTDSERTSNVSQQTGCDIARNAAELIENPKVDAIIVATPTDSHFDYIQLGLDAKKPVLTEKPLGRKLSHIDACFERSMANDTPLFVAFQRRFDPSFASLVKAVRAGDIGQLQFVRSVSRDNPVPTPEYIEMSGGIFHDCMVHDLDMVIHIVGETPSHMASFGSSFIPEIGQYDDFDNVVATLTFPSGVSASIDINRKSVYGYDQRIESFGSGGMLQADNYHNTSLSSASASGFNRPPVDYSFPSRYRDAYLAELQCFVRCARGDEETPITYQDVRTNHLLATGVETAARQKKVVQFNEIESTLASSE